MGKLFTKFCFCMAALAMVLQFSTIQPASAGEFETSGDDVLSTLSFLTEEEYLASEAFSDNIPYCGKKSTDCKEQPDNFGGFACTGGKHVDRCAQTGKTNNSKGSKKCQCCKTVKQDDGTTVTCNRIEKEKDADAK